MIGLEINFIDSKGVTVDCDGPFFSEGELPCNAIAEWYAQGGKIEVNTNEYWGNNADGYDFNNCYSRKTFDTAQALFVACLSDPSEA